jgi:hypothetical protein
VRRALERLNAGSLEPKSCINRPHHVVMSPLSCRIVALMKSQGGVKSCVKWGLCTPNYINYINTTPGCMKHAGAGCFGTRRLRTTRAHRTKPSGHMSFRAKSRNLRGQGQCMDPATSRRMTVTGGSSGVSVVYEDRSSLKLLMAA